MFKYHIIPLFMIYSINSFTQSYIAEYALVEKELPVFDKPDLMSIQQYQYLLDQIKHSKELYTLKSNGKISKYDFLKSIDKQGNKILSIYGKHPFYKNFIQNQFIIETDKQSHGVLESLDELNDWELLNIDSTINNVLCKKASHKIEKSTIAWYSEHIPSNDGPEHYSGLPGLIVFLEREDYHLELLSISYDTYNLELESPEIKSKITYAKYLDTSIAAPPKK